MMEEERQRIEEDDVLYVKISTLKGLSCVILEARKAKGYILKIILLVLFDKLFMLILIEGDIYIVKYD